MLAKVCSAAVNGIDAYPVEVEVNAGFGDTLIVIVGLPDAAVKESRDRVMTALINSGFSFTFGRTTINLAPADVKKEGPSFDLPIAIGMVAQSGWSKECYPSRCGRTNRARSASWCRQRTPRRRPW
jgi:magnesium chelatase family protein